MPRILALVLLYCAFFTALVMIQFARRGGFTRKVGAFVVTGRHRLPGENDSPGAANEYFLDGDAHVFFGGMDFAMASGDEGHAFRIIGEDGNGREALPEKMVISGDSVIFGFPDGTEIIFATRYAGGSQEMLISGRFPEAASGAELPFVPLKKTGIRDLGDGQFVASFDGKNYTFGHSHTEAGRRTLLVSAGEAALSYKVIPESKTFSPENFILPQAGTAVAYNEALVRWIDQNFSLWNRTVSGENSEDLVAALCGEALSRGTYKAAVAAVPQAFLRGSARSFESSVYLGDLGDAYRSLGNREREKLARLSRQINEKSLEFLRENKVIEYFAVRGLFNFIDSGADLVRSIDPAILALDIVPGILEGYMDWKVFRHGTDNPFARLVDQACFVISGSLARTGSGGSVQSDAQTDRVFVFSGRSADTEFNLRLGKALLLYAEDAGDAHWAGIGRSLVLSALSMGDAAGAVKAGLYISETGEITENNEPSALTTARLHRVLSPGDLFPRALAIGAPVNSIWAWTAAQTAGASQENNVLDIAVTFPAGEAHYMIFRGVRPFTKIQLYGMDFRTDSQFERYDSSGWSYIQQEQTLLVKMKHRTQVEHIRIFYS